MRPSALLAAGLGLLLLATDGRAQCPNDDALGNTTPSTAWPLPPGASAFPSLVLADPTAPGATDNDYFSFDLGPGATASFVFDQPSSDPIFVQIYTPGVSFIQGTPVFTGPLEYDFTNPDAVANTYLLRVANPLSSCIEYSFDAFVDPCTSDDVLENFDACDDALTLPPAPTVEYAQLAVLSGDEDWFDVFVPPGATFQADIAFVDADGDIDMTLVDATGGGCGTTLQTSQSTSDAESVLFTNAGASPMDLRVGVYLFSGTCNTYSLDWSVTAAPDDALEDNDDLCSPTISAAPGVYEDLVVYDADSDYYLQQLDPGGRIRYTIDFAHADGDLDMRLWDVTNGCASATLIASSGSVTDREEIVITNPGATAQLVVFEVFYFPNDGGSNTYTMTAGVAAETWVGEIVCDAVLNSIGDTGLVFGLGSAVAADNDLTLQCQALPPNQFGFYNTSRAYGFVANPGGSEGNLCIAGGPIGRLVGPGQIVNSGPSGLVAVSIDLTQLPLGGTTNAAAAGEIWFFQFWHRDVVGGAQTSNFSRALRIEFE